MAAMGAVIDLNADVGESFGPWPMGADDELIPLVTSVNVACGYHAGDPVTIRRAVRLAIESGAAVGAHPGYPDLVGFGRREMSLSGDELQSIVTYQVGALAALAKVEGARLTHVKPHGALYHRLAVDAAAADAVATAVGKLDPSLRLVAPPGSELALAATRHGLGSIAEGFADRVYEPDGSLRSRDLPGALHEDPAKAAGQALSIARDGVATAIEGSTVAVPVATICIHGDTPGARAIAMAVRAALAAAGIELRAPGG